MKNNTKIATISAYPLKAVPKDNSVQASGQSPYLKAVLSSKLRASYPGKLLSMTDSNLAAALRYIAKTK